MEKELLIENLLNKYDFVADNTAMFLDEVRLFYYNGITYNILEKDYYYVCKIIDYIKGVEKC